MITDPDGNLIELTQMSDAWFDYLGTRGAHGVDVLAWWHARS